MTLSSSVRCSRVLDHYYRCAPVLPNFQTSEVLQEPKGFFRFGDVVCYGQTVDGAVASSANGELVSHRGALQQRSSSIVLPFDIDEVADNLRNERYQGFSGWQARIQRSLIRDIYYAIRPALPVSLRKYLQKIYLGDWRRIAFPKWPIDDSVDRLFHKVLALGMQSSGIDRLPFIWFWPHGHQSCAILTHDVETAAGRDFCATLMDLDDSYSIKASFQIVPQKRYAVPLSYLQLIRDRGFEVNVQGLDHDGNLFRDHKSFLRDAKHINSYAREFGALGFRSPILYRNADWFQDLDFSYDMSVPNVARLEAQRGGCCTVMPYFLPGGMVELPLTMTEDYTLFNVLGDYSTRLWKQQIEIIHKSYGLMTFLIHPDYVISIKAQDIFRELLEELGRLRSAGNVWMALPREVDSWWRQRSQMNLVRCGSDWKIEGPGSDRAKLAYAHLAGDGVEYEIA